MVRVERIKILINPNDYICPLRDGKPCDRNCAWLIEAEVETDEYLAMDYICAMGMIATTFNEFVYADREDD